MNTIDQSDYAGFDWMKPAQQQFKKMTFSKTYGRCSRLAC